MTVPGNGWGRSCELLMEINQNLLTAYLRLRRRVGKVYRKFVPIVTRHRDIRAYASIAEEYGLEHIHYGCWDHEGQDVKVAQDNLYLKIKSLIPANVRTIVDVGGGIGGVSNHLAQDGYEPLCIVPDPALIAIGEKKFPRVRFLRGTAEEFSAPAKTFDAAVMIESYQYFSKKPQAIANITRHLAKSGCVVMAEEFSLIPDPLPKEEVLLSYMQSNGYSLETRIDISKQVLPTCRYIYETFGDRMKPLADQWKNNEKVYLSGERHYLLLRFTAQPA